MGVGTMLKQISSIAWMTIRELLFEKVFYILLAFIFVAIALSTLLGQLTYAEQSKLTIDFMLGGIEITLTVFSIFVGLFLFQREYSSGSIFITLSKPLPRYRFLLGKFVGQMAVAVAIAIILTVVLLASISRLGEAFSTPALLQCVALILLQMGILTAITYLFTVLSRGLFPAVATATLFILGKYYTDIETIFKKGGSYFLWVLLRLVPNLSALNTKQLASYGVRLPVTEWGWLAGYAFLCMAFYLFAASLCFENRDLQT
jgi:ABC-type transport system involved in multi-copper enzyme maturation permease subunit